MDAEKQKKLNLISTCLEEDGYEDAEDIDFLLGIVREQHNLLTSHAPEGHNYTNAQYASYLLKNECLQAQLVKYERVVEAARRWRETRQSRWWVSKEGNKDLTGVLQDRMTRDRELITAVDDLKA